MSSEELIHAFKTGGPTLVILILASLGALAVFIERLITLWNVSESARGLSDTISKHLLRGDAAAARSAAERSNAVAADIYLAGFARLDRVPKTGTGIEAAVERERSQVVLKLRRNLWILGTLGATTPFIGLFGTVVGILKSFRDLGLDVGAGGTGGSATVMSGISEALVATAAGILVAVEAVVFFNYFQARITRVAVELRLLSDEFVELLKERPLSAQGQPLPASETTAEGT